MSAARRRRMLQAGLALVAAPWLCRARGGSRDSDDPAQVPRWLAVRRTLWGERPIGLAEAAQLSLQAPRRADDPAFVPVTVRGELAGLRRLTLLIDENPSPIAAVLELPDSGAGSLRLPLETRLRVDDYSWLRAVAETSDGRLLMALRHVRSSGGCSAPPGGDAAAQAAAMGRMRLQTTAPPQPGRPVTLSWQISHPNHSGLAMDAYTRHYTPAHFVRSLRLWQGERALLLADLDFALSENPLLRLDFVPQGDAPLRAEVEDSQARHWHTEIALQELGR